MDKIGYTNPELISSYRENNLGKTIYDTVLDLNPKLVVEFGVLHGYSTICIGQALRDLGNKGQLISYDLFDKYPYKHGSITQVQDEIIKYELEDYIDVQYGNIEEWLKNPHEFDLLHLDISNEGSLIEKIANTFPDKNILFEGGSTERDKVEWMVKYNNKPIYPLKTKIKYDIINESFPSISLLKRN